nr:hypothetical protein [Tanacetum cinerariifolium]
MFPRSCSSKGYLTKPPPLTEVLRTEVAPSNSRITAWSKYSIFILVWMDNKVSYQITQNPCSNSPRAAAWNYYCSSTKTTNPSYCFIHQTPHPKKEEYDILAMKMEHYLSHTDYLIWQVIQNGNGHVSVTTYTNGMIKVLPPKTAEEVVARERERKARTTLLMALLEDHLAKFHKMADAKEMWEAIKSRFEGLHKGFDRFQTLLSQLEIHGAGVSHEDANQKFLRSLPSFWSQVALILRTKPGLDTLSFDDLYNNLRVFERDIKCTTASSSNTQNVAFVSAKNTSSTNDVSTAYSVSSLSVLKSQKEGSSSYTDEVAMIAMRIKKFHKRTERKLQFDTKDLVGFDNTKVECFNFHKIGHFARDYRAKENQDSRKRDAGYDGNKTRDNGRRPAYQDDLKALVTINGEDIDWSRHVEEDAQNYAMMAYSSSNLGSDNETSANESNSKPSDYASCESDSSVEPSISMSKPVENASKVVCEPKVWTDAPIIEEYESDSDNDLVSNVQEDKEKPSFAFTDSVKHDDPHIALKDKGIVDSGCSRHMIGNKAHLTDYQEFKGGSVAFGGSNGKIPGKGKIKARRLDFEDVYYVEELKHYNLFLYHKCVTRRTRFFSLILIVLMKNNSEEIDLNEEHFVLPIWSAYSTTVKNSRDRIEKNTGFKTCEKPVTQVEQNTSTSNTNLINTASTPISTAGPSREFNDGELSYPDPSKYALPDDPSMPHLEDIYASPSKGIFTDSSYDDEGVTRSKVNKNFEAHALVSYIQKQQRNNHKDFQHCLLACFLSQIEPKKISQALEDESWVDAMQEELPQQEEGINYDEIFAPVARIEAIRIFLAFYSYMGFIVYQMDVKSAFLYSTLDEEIVKTASTSIETQKPLVKDEEAADMDVSGCSKDFTSSSCEENLRYLKGQPKLGLWYPKVSSFDLEAYLDSDYVGANLDKKSTTGDYGFNFTNTKIYIDNESTICTVKNPVFHSKIKHIEIKHHFIRDAYEKKLIQVLKIHTDDNVADLLTKAFDVSSKELASPKQKTLGKDISNPLMAGRLPKTTLPTRFVQLLIDHQLGDMSHHNDIYDNSSLTKKVFANMKRVGTGFSGVVTALFDNMLGPAANEVGLIQDDVQSITIPTEPSTAKPHKKHKTKKQQTQAPKVPSPEPSPEHKLPSPSNDPLPGGKDSMKLKELMDLCTRLSNKVLELESEVIDIKSAYKDMIEKLEGRVDTLEEENMVLKDLHSVYSKVDTSAHAEPYRMDLEHQEKVLSMQDVDDEELAEVEKVLEVVKAVKLMTEVVTTAGATTTAEATKVSVPRRRRCVVIQEPEETTSRVVVHSEIEQHEAFSRQLEAELKADINWNAVMEQVKRSKSEIRHLFEKHYNYNQAFLEEVNEEVTIPKKEVEVEAHKKEGESLEKEITKKQKIDEEAEELKNHLQIVSNDDDDVYTEASILNFAFLEWWCKEVELGGAFLQKGC